MSDHPIITGTVRTPIGAFMGGLASVPAPALGAHAVTAALERSGVPAAAVDDVILGCVLQGGLGQGPARQAAIAAGIPETTPAMAINMLCGSGLRAVALAAQAVRAGDAGVVVAGGMENMSRAPHLTERTRGGQRLGDITLRDSLLGDGLWCALTDQHMGSTAENIAERHGVDRAAQDAFAAESQARTAAAQAAGYFDGEIAPVTVPSRRGPAVVARDEHPRPDTTVATLAGLKPAFRAEGTVTAGNASGINDGAAALLVMHPERARALGVSAEARILAHACSGVAPEVMGMGPVEATRRALARADLTVGDIDLFELNEAFAAQAVAVQRELAIDPQRLNIQGGAIALGHPVGASGARILVTLVHALRRRGGGLGVAALCVGGGMGVAVVIAVDG